jgi:ATP-dependent exoDNAse (exonuclease V) beta subunit
MKNISDLEDFAESTGDNTLIQLIKIVLEYGRDLPEFINKIKMAQVADEHRLEADIIYSTIHRCKGLEYDEVFILDDFINEDVIDRAKQDNDPKTLQIIEEEINILYVAVTRAKLKLRLPVRLLYLHPESGNKQSQNGDGKVDFDKIDSNPHSSASSSNLSRSWNKHEDENLLYLIGANFSDETIAKRLNRPLEEVKSRKDVLRSLL